MYPQCVLTDLESYYVPCATADSAPPQVAHLPFMFNTRPAAVQTKNEEHFDINVPSTPVEVYIPELLQRKVSRPTKDKHPSTTPAPAPVTTRRGVVELLRLGIRPWVLNSGQYLQ